MIGSKETFGLSVLGVRRGETARMLYVLSGRWEEDWTV